MSATEHHAQELLPRIDWKSAEIEDGNLSVRIAGNAPKGWAKRFEAVLDLLGHTGAGWSEIAVRKQGIKVKGVLAGAESDLRHLLESVLLQVNSDLAPDQDSSADGDDAHEGKRDAAEREMAATFRGFADEQSKPEQ